MVAIGRLAKGWSSKQITVAGLIVLVASLQAFVARPVVDQWLVNTVRSESQQWADLIFDGLEDVAQCVAASAPGSEPEDHSSEHARLAGHIEAAILSGRLHQIDVLDPTCDCQVSIVSPRLTFSERPPRSATRMRLPNVLHGSSGSIEVSSLATISALHTLLVTNSSIRFQTGPQQNMIDLSPDNVVVTSDDDRSRVAFYKYPSTSGERLMGSLASTHTMVGGRSLTLRLVHDITDHAIAFRGIFWTVAAVLIAIASGLVMLAFRAAARSRQAEQISDKQARFLAERDPLTGALNRYGFGKRVKLVLEDCRQDGRQACFVQIDANKFKEINDQHGHHIGDLALVAIADLIRDSFPKDAVIARLGGDEFAVVWQECKTSKSFADIFANVPSTTTATDDDTAQTIDVSFSAGYAVFPVDGETLTDLMKAADLALYSVKKDQRSGFGGYSKGMTDAFERRLWEINGIQDAADSGAIVPHYQPIINATTGAIEGVEALVRWQHPTLGLLPPARFEHALIDPNAATKITDEMAHAVLNDLQQWHRQGYDISAGLNLGESDLKNPKLVERLTESIKSRKLPSRALAIEVTENAANMFNLDELKPTLKAIRDAGMFIALDDFGTGGSSISILKLLPCTALKIDKSFVDRLVSDSRDYAIVQALTSLGHNMQLKVIAEGVETEQQRTILRHIGVDMLQGHLMSKAVPAHEITRYLEEDTFAEVASAFPRHAIGA